MKNTCVWQGEKIIKCGSTLEIKLTFIIKFLMNYIDKTFAFSLLGLLSVVAEMGNYL